MIAGSVAAIVPSLLLLQFLSKKDIGKIKTHKDFLSENKIKFADIGGYHEAKDMFKEIVRVLKNKEYYENLGIRHPKGVLMYGPSGTGKTMLARAFANEAGVKFIYICGSEFVELYVGVGSSRVRELFSKARAAQPCIIFIDEIDAIGFRRGASMGANREFDSTLNQMLAEMDGLGDNNGIVVIGATNQELVLDTALIRPGRFDKKMKIGKPSEIERLEIISIILRSKSHSLGIDEIKRITKKTNGYTGAELGHIINEAASVAVKNERIDITEEDVNVAIKLYSVSKQHFEPKGIFRS